MFFHPESPPTRRKEYESGWGITPARTRSTGRGVPGTVCLLGKIPCALCFPFRYYEPGLQVMVFTFSTSTVLLIFLESNICIT